MYKDIAKDFLLITQEIYKIKEDQMQIEIRGEQAILLYLNGFPNKNLTPGDLSRKLNLKTARVASILNQLESKEFVIRKQDKIDKRRTFINLTDEGIKEAINIETNHLNKISNLFEKFGKDDSLLTIDLLNKLLKILKKKNEDD